MAAFDQRPREDDPLRGAAEAAPAETNAIPAAANGAPALLTVLDAGAGGNLVVPGGNFLLEANYVRQGPDLLLVGADGSRVLVLNYFGGGVPPDLMTDWGARVAPQMAEALAGPAFPGQYAQAAPTVAAPIGTVQTVTGTAFATRADGTRVALNTGDAVFQGDVVETPGTGAVGLVFLDDSVFSLSNNGRMILDELVYDPSTKVGNSALSIVQGVFSFVSGQIAANGFDAMKVATPVVTIGIRGTAVAGTAAAEGQQNNVTLLPDPLTGRVGEIAVSNGSGTTRVLNAPNQSVAATSFLAPPPPPVVLSAAQVTQLFGQALQALPPPPAPPPPPPRRRPRYSSNCSRRRPRRFKKHKQSAVTRPLPQPQAEVRQAGAAEWLPRATRRLPEAPPSIPPRQPRVVHPWATPRLVAQQP